MFKLNDLCYENLFIYYLQLNVRLGLESPFDER
jgi:hypothetical protein